MRQMWGGWVQWEPVLAKSFGLIDQIFLCVVYSFKATASLLSCRTEMKRAMLEITQAELCCDREGWVAAERLLGHRGLAWLPALPALPAPSEGRVSRSGPSRAPQGTQQAGAGLQAASSWQGLSWEPGWSAGAAVCALPWAVSPSTRAACRMRTVPTPVVQRETLGEPRQTHK